MKKINNNIPSLTVLLTTGMFVLSGFGKDSCDRINIVSNAYKIGAVLICIIFLFLAANYYFKSKVINILVTVPILFGSFYLLTNDLFHIYLFETTSIIFFLLYFFTKGSELVVATLAFALFGSLSVLTHSKCTEQAVLYSVISILVIINMVSILSLEKLSTWSQVFFKNNVILISFFIFATIVTLLFISPAYIYILIALFFIPYRKV